MTPVFNDRTNSKLRVVRIEPREGTERAWVRPGRATTGDAVDFRVQGSRQCWRKATITRVEGLTLILVEDV